MRNYEAMFIFRPQLEEKTLEKEIEAVERIVKEKSDGKVSFENLGKKTLTYPIEKNNEGYYVNYNFTALPSSIIKIKEDLKHRANIIRFIIFLKEKEE